MRDKVERVVHQVPVEHPDGRGPGTFDQMGESGEVGLLTLVQRQGAGGFDQRLGAGQQARVIGHREHPGFSQVCHGEIGRGPTGLLEQADRVAVDEVERPYCLIVCSDARFRGAGEVMSLSVLDHCWLYCFRTSAAGCARAERPRLPDDRPFVRRARSLGLAQRTTQQVDCDRSDWTQIVGPLPEGIHLI